MSYFAKKDVKNMNVFLLFLGVRQEQDIYVRLIDSVTKQVKHLFIKLGFLIALRTFYNKRVFKTD